MRKIVHRGMLYVLAFVLVAGYPVNAMAEVQEPTTDPVPVTTTVAPSAEAPVVATPAEEQEPPLTYTYNPATEKWDSKDWQFNPQSGAYEKPPAPIIIEPEATDTTEKKIDKTVDTTVTLDSKIKSDATSGDALLSKNTEAGNAITGDAAAVANIMNVVNSSIVTDSNQKIATFSQDIMGDVKGDIVLYPLLLKAMLEANAKENSATTINATTDLGINNYINLAARSGDATVDSNTTAGNATTGSATAMANVVNILNSMIAAQDSFIGTINIYGSLDGDILVAPDFIPQMLANNGGGKTEEDLKVSTQDTTTIVNNITAVAESGAASVFGNTTGGNGTTGDADSSVVIFNVTGHDIVAENSMLIFVNVLGKWVGMIVDAPQGATAALLGTGVTKNTKYEPDLTVNSQSTHGITNTIAISAETGDAVVSNNTTGGNAISGQAKAMANVANMSGTQLNLSGWFKVLFINIQGDWCGSFGIDTSCGGFSGVPMSQPTGPLQFIPAEAPQINEMKPRFTLVDSRTLRSLAPVDEPASEKSVLASTSSPQVLHSSDSSTKKDKKVEDSYNYRLFIIAGSVFLIGASAMGFRRLLQS